MGTIRWQSIYVGLTCAALVALGQLFVGQMAAPPAAYAQLASTILLFSLVSGIVSLFLSQRFIRKQEIQMGQLVDHIYSQGQQDRQRVAPTKMPYRQTLPDLALVVRHFTKTIFQRADALSQKQQGFEIQNRISVLQSEQMQRVLNSMSEIVLVTNKDNELVLSNAASASFFGIDLDHDMHKPIDQLVQHKQLINLIKDVQVNSINNTTSGRPSTSSPSKPICLKDELQWEIDEEPITYRITLHAIGGPESTGLTGSGVIAILRNITHEKQLSEAKSDFVSNVSHELRTPLSSIKAYMEMLIDGEVTDEKSIHAFYNVVHSESNRLSRLIDNILNISRIESGEFREHRQRISLNGLVKEALDVMLPQARVKGIDLSYAPMLLSIDVKADKELLFQAILNLISNAIKYTNTDGSVNVRLQVDQTGEMIHLKVRDTGIGISPRHLPRVFDKFYRIQSHQKMAPGSGLGLNLVKHIVETVHHGSVSVHSVEGQGSEFQIALAIEENILSHCA